ncbi:uncharacterized protein EI90DRAFT_3129647 [Cantharellus anzutake]|uniref:uncharacterized protein n=1 Tax=Cantharellus anzutake TaxID=1750568 RepID=UPI0019057430|nr:uncharacterized protein EI90DRAFT_3129647 [Cantharellus anzutake]KAF8324682.1 hypothetical protein EI90DRAFT_3129647 [Cantharellus anzutake]
MARNMWTEFSDYRDRMYKGSAIVPLRQLVDLEGNCQVDEEFVARYHETWGGSIDPLMHEMMGLLPDNDGLLMMCPFGTILNGGSCYGYKVSNNHIHRMVKDLPFPSLSLFRPLS